MVALPGVLGIRKTVAVAASLCALLAAPSAAAITRDDPDDVEIRLDVSRVSLVCSFVTGDTFCAVGVRFHERVRVTHGRRPFTRFFLDAFGSSSPDFIIAFRYHSVRRTSHAVGCRLIRLSDHAVLAVSDVEESRREDSIYTQIQTPRTLTADANWRVTAALRGDVHDAAPDVGWYQHV
jgi:hypothetical protein